MKQMSAKSTKRRSFLKMSLASLPIPALFLNSAVAKAQSPSAQWQTVPGTNGGLKIMTVFSNEKDGGTARGVLYSMASGFVVGAHRHPKGEYSYLVEGSFEFPGIRFKAGDAIYMQPGSTHPRGRAGSGGAIIFVFTPAPIIRI